MMTSLSDQLPLLPSIEIEDTLWTKQGLLGRRQMNRQKYFVLLLKLRQPQCLQQELFHHKQLPLRLMQLKQRLIVRQTKKQEND